MEADRHFNAQLTTRIFRPDNQSMKHLIRFSLILLFPIVTWADGVSVELRELSDFRFVLLVKILAIDAKKHLAQVKILKIFRGPSVSELEFDEGKEASLSLHRPTDAVSGKWVIERHYWDLNPTVRAGETGFFLSGESGYEWVPFSEARKNKFDVFFSPTKFESVLKKATTDELARWMKDPDLLKAAVSELERRKIFDVEFLLKKMSPSDFRPIIHKYFEGKTDEDRRKFYDRGRRALLKGGFTSSSTAAFLEAYQDYSSNSLSFADELDMYSRLSGAVPEFVPFISHFHLKFQTRLDAGNSEGLLRLAPQSIDLYVMARENEPIPSCLPFSYFFRDLKGEELAKFMRLFAKGYVATGLRGRNAEAFEMIFEEFQKHPDLETAEILAKTNSVNVSTEIKNKLDRVRLHLNEMKKK